MCKEKKCSGLKCALIGVGIGLAVGMVGKMLMDTNTKALKKKANKVADAMENLVDTTKNMFQ